ncbi:hypothetical protein [Streptomyces sp. CBMA156]|uniref:hypothetical protein n=1 Tax=Streptomyces sp. CBMA156 TaxID=1930280 RepID=UPI001661D482|nr:hypothetical protein [Streptomyces sp. CBMA156]MBD0675660.1 hypothetical protein [Streptomyces sp. CBMA156]
MIDTRDAQDAVRETTHLGRTWAPLTEARLPEPDGRSRAAACLDGAPARIAARLARGAASRPPSVAMRLDRARFELLALCHLAVEDARAPAWVAALADTPAIEPHGAFVLGALCHLAVHEGDDEDGAMCRALADGPRTWWRLAAGAGNLQASYALALVAAGRGDQGEARHWYEQARQLSGHEDVRAATLSAYGGFQPTHGLCAPVREALAGLPASRDADFGRTPAIDPSLAAALRRHRTGPCCGPTPP